MESNYTAHHLLLFTGIEVQCQGACTWILHNKKEVLTPFFMETLMEDNAIDWVKPLLRPLQSMMDEEATHIAKLCLDISEVNFKHALLLRYSEDEIKIATCYHEKLIDDENKDIVTIRDNFDVYHSEHFTSAFNQPQIFQYLIQKQFDVFNWIKSGIALDKTKTQ